MRCLSNSNVPATTARPRRRTTVSTLLSPCVVLTVDTAPSHLEISRSHRWHQPTACSINSRRPELRDPKSNVGATSLQVNPPPPVPLSLGIWLPQTSHSNRGWLLWPPPPRYQPRLTMPRRSRPALIEGGRSSTRLGSNALPWMDRYLGESRREILRMTSCRRLWGG